MCVIMVCITVILIRVTGSCGVIEKTLDLESQFISTHINSMPTLAGHTSDLLGYVSE